MPLSYSIISGFVIVYLSVTAGITVSAQIPRSSGSYSPAVIATSDFLRRSYQASVVAGKWIYLDGGSFSFMGEGVPQYQYGRPAYAAYLLVLGSGVTASTLLSIDLSRNWTNTTVVFQSTPKPDGVPNLDGPSLWYHDQEDIFYSGFTGDNASFGDPRVRPPLSLWTFKPDGTGSGVWNEVINNTSPVWDSLTRPMYPLQAHGSNSAWILGGNLLPNEPPIIIGENIVHFDMVSRTFENSTVQCCNASNGIAAGAMQYVPSFGPEGLFVVLGGVNGNGRQGRDLLGFDTLSIFDPAKRKWWNQTTTGSEPSPRTQFCTAGISSTNGTYEIFVYAGWDGKLESIAIQFDTINILTLPAFHWISVPYNPQNPRHGHSCNSVGGSQIISIGGVDSNSKQQGIRSTYDSAPDPFAQGLAIFDLTTLEFANQYTADAPPYEQSDKVKQFYAQSQGEYLKGLSPGVAALLQTTHFTNPTHSTSPNTTSASPSSSPAASQPSFLTPHATKRNVGVIAGGAAGGAIATLLLAVAAVIVFLKKKRNSFQRARPTTASELSEEPYQENSNVLEMHEDARPIELAGLALHELNEQSLQELEQPRLPMELHAHKYPELQTHND